jgi:hypothetical protein
MQESRAQKKNISFILPHCCLDLAPRQKKIPINLGGQFVTLGVNVVTIKYYCFDKIQVLGLK